MLEAASFHHQPEAQHPNFPLSVSWQADYPSFGTKRQLCRSMSAFGGKADI